ncbi:hypothetical protein FA13DRAFT_1735682, partial [Coprinellus micaceus]
GLPLPRIIALSQGPQGMKYANTPNRRSLSIFWQGCVMKLSGLAFTYELLSFLAVIYQLLNEFYTVT